MAVTGSLSAIGNPNYGVLADADLDRQFSDKLSPKGYSSDFVEGQLGGVGKIPITFEKQEYNSTPGYLGLTGVNIPSSISGLPNSLGYMRSAAYSVAESYGQLKNRSEKEYTNDEILEMIINRVVELFEEEIARVEEYMNQENVILMPELEEKFKRHLEALEYCLDIFSGKVREIKVDNVKYKKKAEVENIFKKENPKGKKAANDDIYDGKLQALG